MENSEHAPESTRRDFVKKAGSIAFGGLATGIPLAAGLSVFLDPLHRKGSSRGFVRVTSIDSLPDDGAPRKYSVLADRSDAWNKSPHVPVGAVYLRRIGEKTVEALNVVCPHAGCPVAYNEADKVFGCPCHNSKFSLDGRIADPKSPSPRPLDSLEVEIRNGSEIWVKYQDFLAGKAEKIAVS